MATSFPLHLTETHAGNEFLFTHQLVQDQRELKRDIVIHDSVFGECRNPRQSTWKRTAIVHDGTLEEKTNQTCNIVSYLTNKGI